MLQFIGLANYFRDHVPNMTEMVKPLRDMIPLGKYQRTGKLIWTPEIPLTTYRTLPYQCSYTTHSKSTVSSVIYLNIYLYHPMTITSPILKDTPAQLRAIVVAVDVRVPG
jgi:hypothetical protein